MKFLFFMAENCNACCQDNQQSHLQIWTSFVSFARWKCVDTLAWKGKVEVHFCVLKTEITNFCLWKKNIRIFSSIFSSGFWDEKFRHQVGYGMYGQSVVNLFGQFLVPIFESFWIFFPLYFSIKFQEMGIFTQGDIILITILLHDYSCLPSLLFFTFTYQLTVIL